MQRPLEERLSKEEVLKIPKACITELIRHKHYRAFRVFLQLKPLYISSVIMNDNGKMPYRLMAHYCGISDRSLREKIKQLKKYKLACVDNNRNIHLASYKKFVNIFKPQYLRRMRKYMYQNVAGADQLIKTAAVQENLRKQAYIVKNKIISKEIYGTVNAQKDRIKQPKGIYSPSAQTDCPRTIGRTDLSKSAIRKIRKILLNDYERLLHKHKGIYREQMEQPENGYPEINPYVTLSCAGIGRLFGLSSSGGYYQREKLLASQTMLKMNRDIDYVKTYPVSHDIQQGIAEMGGNMFSYNYPVKLGRHGIEEKFFIHLPDQLTANLNFIYVNGKN